MFRSTVRTPPRRGPRLLPWLAGIALIHPAAGLAALGYVETLDLALAQAPALQAARAAVGSAAAALPAAATRPDPKLAVGIENWPVAGPDRYRTTRDAGTMQRLALMQEMPSSTRREARSRVAEARVAREQAGQAAAALGVRRDAALAWVAAYHAERRLALLADLLRPNELLQQTLPTRIGAGQAPPVELPMARQEALMLADRADEYARDRARARAELRRWVGARADEPLAGEPALPPIDAEWLRANLHRHTELAPLDAMRTLAQAETHEADAEGRGDWSWEVAYSRRPRYDDMVSLQLSFELPWQRDRRQQPMVDAKRREVERIEAERDDLLRKHAAELDQMLAELKTIERQLERLQGPLQVTVAERQALATASYEAGRGDLAAVLAARQQRAELRLRAIDLESQRDALRVRLTTLIGENLR